MKLRLNKNQVVCCTSLEEVEQCFKIFKEFDTSASNDIYDLMMLGWKKYGNRVYFRLEDGELFYGDLKHPLYDSFQILTAQDFLTMHSFPFMGYFEGNKNTTYGNGIIAILESLGGKNVQMLSGCGSDYYSIDKNGAIVASKYQPRDCMCCNPLHYLHLIENSEIPNNSESTELADLRKQLAESEERERIANNIITEKRKEIEDNKNSINELDDMCTALYKELDAAKVKADKWDAIPKVTVVRGAKDRGKEVFELLMPIQRWDNRSNFAFFENPESLYYFDTKYSMCAEIQSDNVLYNIFISTQTITELPPLEEKEDIEEFWLKIGNKCLATQQLSTGNESRWMLVDVDFWDMDECYARIMPFNAETEKLIGTTDESTKQYKYLGVKSYFNQE